MALLAALVLAAKFRRDFGFLAAAAMFVVAAAATVMAIRGYSYAIWLGMPLSLRWRRGCLRRCGSRRCRRGSPPVCC